MTSSYEQRILDAILRHAEALERSDDNVAAEALCEALTAAKLLRAQRREVIEPVLVHASADRELHQAKVEVANAMFELDGASVPARTRALIEQHFQHALKHAEKAVRIARGEAG